MGPEPFSRPVFSQQRILSPLFTGVRGGRGILRNSDARWARGLFTTPNLYAPPQHVVPTRAARRAPDAVLAAPRARSMQDPGFELPRITLPRRTWVNKGKERKG